MLTAGDTFLLLYHWAMGMCAIMPLVDNILYYMHRQSKLCQILRSDNNHYEYLGTRNDKIFSDMIFPRISMFLRSNAWFLKSVQIHWNIIYHGGIGLLGVLIFHVSQYHHAFTIWNIDVIIIVLNLDTCTVFELIRVSTQQLLVHVLSNWLKYLRCFSEIFFLWC